MEAGLEPKPDTEGWEKSKNSRVMVRSFMSYQHYYIFFTLRVRLAQPCPVCFEPHISYRQITFVATYPELGHNDTASSVLGCAAKVLFFPLHLSIVRL
jgi:hypothetical protein